MSVDPSTVDLVAGELWALGAVAVVEEPDELRAGFADGSAAEHAAEHLGAVHPVELVSADAPPTEWLDHLKSTVVGRLVIRQPGATARLSADQLSLTIDPTLAFGHGGHASTRLALELVHALVEPGATVLDVGSGTGVLAIAALALGAGRAVALDRDPSAVAATEDNARLNRMAELLTARDTPVGELTGRFDLVLANLTIDIHEEIGAAVLDRVEPGGALVTSGVLVSQLRRLATVYGPTVTAERREGGWAATARRLDQTGV